MQRLKSRGRLIERFLKYGCSFYFPPNIFLRRAEKVFLKSVTLEQSAMSVPRGKSE